MDIPRGATAAREITEATMRLRYVKSVAIGAVLSVMPARAHHSHGNYDLTKWTAMEERSRRSTSRSAFVGIRGCQTGEGTSNHMGARGGRTCSARVRRDQREDVQDR